MADYQLKYYGGRSILASFFESPGYRKREHIFYVLDAFEESKFILFGDSGEHDLELYLSIALERPSQILGVFIRDLTSERIQGEGQLISGPANPAQYSNTPSGNSNVMSDIASPLEEDELTKFASGKEGFRRRSSLSTLTKGYERTLATIQDMNAAQQKGLRRAARWEERVVKARRKMPKDIILVLFNSPTEISAITSDLVETAFK